MYKHLVINAYPRSGSVYFASTISLCNIECILASLHTPYIIGNEGIYNLAIIRNPYDCIASLSFMRYSHYKAKNIETPFDLDSFISRSVEEYLLYPKYCNKYFNDEKLFILDFSEMVSDPIKNAKLALNKFEIDYDKNIAMTAQEVNNIISSQPRQESDSPANGHMPREKSSDRLMIEDIVSNSKHLDIAYEEYQMLLSKIKS